MAKEKEIQREIEKILVGKRIIGTRYMTRKEAKKLDIYSRPIIITLDDGNEIVPMRDDEGNDGGSMFTTFIQQSVIPVI